jgi:cholesterol transport system auxiliary component
MLYRLAYADGTRLASYRDSRWAAPPAALLHERLRQRLARTPGAAGAVTLRIELEEFSQIFDSPASSRAVVRLRAELVEGGSGRVLRQQTFAEEVPAASADAPGGARALTQATDAVLARLIHWTAD